MTGITRIDDIARAALGDGTASAGPVAQERLDARAGGERVELALEMARDGLGMCGLVELGIVERTGVRGPGQRPDRGGTGCRAGER